MIANETTICQSQNNMDVSNAFHCTAFTRISKTYTVIVGYIKLQRDERLNNYKKTQNKGFHLCQNNEWKTYMTDNNQRKPLHCMYASDLIHWSLKELYMYPQWSFQYACSTGTSLVPI